MGQIISLPRGPLCKLVTAVSPQLDEALYLSETEPIADLIWTLTMGAVFFFARDYPILAPVMASAAAAFAATAFDVGDQSAANPDKESGAVKLNQYALVASGALTAIAAEFLAIRFLAEPLGAGFFARFLVSYLAGFGGFEGYIQPANRNATDGPVYQTTAWWITMIVSFVISYVLYQEGRALY